MSQSKQFSEQSLPLSARTEQIKQIDGALVYSVRSGSRDDVEHRVDLEEFECSGKCTCENFTFNIEPKLKSGQIKPNTARAHCKHITKVRKMVADLTIRRVAEHQNQN